MIPCYKISPTCSPILGLFLASLVYPTASCFADVVDAPGSTLTAAEQISNSGVIVGFYNDSGGTTHGFLLNGGNFSTLDFPGASATFAKGINNRGQIVGDIVLGGADSGFSLSGGMYTQINVPGADSTDAAAINSTGQIVGAYDTGGTFSGFLLSGGTYTPINIPGADDTSAAGVNDAGQIVGSYDVSGVDNGFLLSGGSYVTLDYPGALDTFASAINNLGEVVGFYFDDSFEAHGFLLDGGVYRSLDFPGALDTYAKGINDGGTIVGFFDSGGASQGFVTPEPDLFWPVAALGLCCGLWALVRRRAPLRERSRRRARQAGRALLLLRAPAKAKTGFVVSTFLLLTALVPVTLQAQSSSLTFVYPDGGQVVGGTNLVLWVSSDGPPTGASVVFDYSPDGVSFTPLPTQEAPDFGPVSGSYTTAIDTTLLPVGTAFFRARFETDASGPVLSVDVRRLPSPSCSVLRLSALSVMYDCSASQDENGGIGSYAFDFGDGSGVSSTVPVVSHTYPTFGIYPLTVTETDAVGLTDTLYKQLVLVELAQLQNRPPTCGCGSMTVSGTPRQDMMTTTIPDPRRAKLGGGGAPLGPDPVFLSFNFQVSATLTKDSDISRCTEGQEVRGNQGSTANGGNPDVIPLLPAKMACTAGRMLSRCNNAAACDTVACQGSNGGVTDCNTAATKLRCGMTGGTCVQTCAGGARHGQNCNTAATRAACLNGGGLCRGRGDGVCTMFPFKGGMRGNDDYQTPSASGFPKIHAGGMPVWVDFVGVNTLRHGDADSDEVQAGDFRAFVSGAAGNCSCHFTTMLNWDNTNQRYRTPPTGIAVVNDGDTTANCTVR